MSQNYFCLKGALVASFIFLNTVALQAQIACPIPVGNQTISNPNADQGNSLVYEYDTAGNTGGVPDNTSDVEFYELILMEGDGTAPNAATAAASMQITQAEADANGGVASFTATGLLELATYTGYVRIKCFANAQPGPFSSEAPTEMTWSETTFDNAQMVPDAPVTVNDAPDLSIDVYARSEQEPTTANPDALTAELFTCVDCNDVFTEGSGFGAQNLVPGRVTATNLSATLDAVSTLGATVQWAARYTYTFTAGGNQTTRIIDSEIQSYVVQSPINFDVATASDLEVDGENLPVLLLEGTLDSNASIEVSVTGGSATINEDFTFTNPTTVTIPAGTYDGTAATGVAITGLSITDDVFVEADETIDFALGSVMGEDRFFLGDTNTSTYTIENDDAYVFNIEQTTDGAEPDTNASFTVTLTPMNTSGGDLTVDIAFDGTVIRNEDYETNPTNLANVSIPSGESEAVVTLTTLDDDLVEETETIEATISNPSEGSINTNTATANLADDDVYEISIETSENGDGAEPDDNVSFTVSLSTPNDTGGDITVDIAFSGTATEGDDYAIGPTSVAIADGESQAEVILDVTNDALVEQTETVIATISNPAPERTAIVANEATADIVDDDNFNINIEQTTDGAEPETNASFTVSLSTPNDSGNDITVNIAFSGTAEEGTDYETGPTQVTFGANEQNQVVTLTTIDDIFVEDTETIIATISNASNGSIATDTATANLADDDDFEISIETTTNGEEPATDAVFTVSLNQENTSGADITVDINYSGTATEATGAPMEQADYDANNPPLMQATVTIPQGETMATVTLEVLDDAVVEGTETIIATIFNETDGTIVVNEATADLLDDDVYEIEIALDQDGAEPDTRVEFEISVSPTNNSGDDITVDVTYTGTATDGDDYVGIMTVAIPDGANTATLSLDVEDDALVEGDETVTATISNPMSDFETAIITNEATGTITDDDAYDISIAQTTDGAEPDQNASFTVSLSTPNESGNSITVDIAFTGTAIQNGDGVENPDYEAGPTQVTFASGEDTQVVTLTTIEDVFVEDTETIIATISDPTAPGVIVEDEATANLVDNDAYVFNIVKTTDGAEPDTDASFTVSVSPMNTTGDDITVDIAFTGTATDGADYAEGLDMVSISDGQSMAAVTLETIDDELVEGDETIIATISNPSVGSIDMDTDTADLADDDDYDISIERTTDGAERDPQDDEDASFTVSLSTPNDSGSDITVDIAFTGAATEGVDYEMGPMQVTFGANENTQVVTLVTIDDNITEGDETIIATISNQTDGNIVNAEATALILDNDDFSITVEKTTDGAEPNDPVSFIVRVNPPNDSGAPISVDVGYDGTATEDIDYMAGPTQVSIPDGGASASIVLNVIDDALNEGSEDIDVTISNASDGVIRENMARAIIADDDGDVVEIEWVDDVEFDADEADGNGTPLLTIDGTVVTDTEVAIIITSTNIDEGDDFTITLPFVIPAGTYVPNIRTVRLNEVITIIDDNIVELDGIITIEIDEANLDPSLSLTDANNDGDITSIVDYTVIDDDFVNVEYLVSTSSVDEDGMTTDINFEVSGADFSTFGTPSVVTVSVTGGTATNGEDYNFTTPVEVNIPNADYTTPVLIPLTVEILDDMIVEGDETVTFDVALKTEANDPMNPPYSIKTEIGDQNTTELTIVENDAYDFAIAQTTDGAEPGTNASFTVTVTPMNTSGDDLTVDVAYAGTATNGEDYETGDTTVSIPDGESSAVLELVTIDDELVEGDESIDVTISNPSEGTISTDMAMANLVDNDEYEFSIAQTTDGAEPDTNASFTVSLNTPNATGDDLTVDIDFSGTAIEGSDFETGPTTVSIADGESEAVVTLTTIDDEEVEDTETIEALISNSSQGSITEDMATANLEDDDAYDISIAQTTDGAEPDTNASFTFTLSPMNTSGEDITVDVAYAGTATSGMDYETGPMTVSFADGESTAVVELVTIDDALVEGDESIDVTISNPSQGTISTDNATANLADDDAYEISIAQTTDGAEPDTNASFTVSLSTPNATGNDITVDVSYDGTATEGTDYETGQTTATIADGESETLIELVTIDDMQVEGTETIETTISNPSEGTITNEMATANLIDNEVFTFTINQTTDGAEPDTNASFTVTLVPANDTGSDATVDIAFGGTATEGADYEMGPTTVTIPDGESEAVVTLATTDDGIVEGTETIEATISNPSIGEIANETATANLEDDDMYDISIAQTTDGAEPDTDATFTVSVSPMNTSGMPITVDVALAGTATEDSDYSAGWMGSQVVIPDGESEAVLTLFTIDDDEVEGTETIEATISNPSQGMISTAMATTNLADDDGYDLSITQTEDGAEPNTNAVFTITVSPMNTSGEPITVDVSYAGTATNGADYETDVMSASIPDGQSQAQITLITNDDEEVEGTETIEATISNPSQGMISTATATANLADDDMYDISIAQATDGAEPDTNASFIVSVSPMNTSGETITVDVAYAGTASNGTDYGTGVMTAMIADGQSEMTITLVTFDDAEVEGTETIDVTISNPSQGTISTDMATANLEDDDMYDITIAQATDGAEPDTNASFTVSVSPMNTSGMPITVDVDYAGTATNGTDYETGAMTATIADGESSTVITLVTLDDNVNEGTETIEAFISNPSQGMISNAMATANLVDNEVFSFSINQTADGSEPGIDAMFTVSLTPANNTGEDMTVDIDFAGTATEGVDYMTGPMTVTIPDGESEAVVTLGTIDDTEIEGTETIEATISNPSIGEIAAEMATANLEDDDFYMVSIAQVTDGMEPSQNASFTVSVSPMNTSGMPITVDVAYGGTAINGTDYESGALTVSIPDGETSVTLTLETIDDNLPEETETIEVDISNLSNNAVIAVGSATADLFDDEVLGTETFDPSEIKLFPNPATTELNISVAVEKVTFYSVSGSRVLVSTSNKIDLGTLQAGVYIVQIETQDGAATKRLIKE